MYKQEISIKNIEQEGGIIGGTLDTIKKIFTLLQNTETEGDRQATLKRELGL